MGPRDMHIHMYIHLTSGASYLALDVYVGSSCTYYLPSI